MKSFIKIFFFVIFSYFALIGISFAKECKKNDSIYTLNGTGYDFTLTKEWKKAFNCFQIAAEQYNDSYAQGWLGDMYASGDGVELDYKKAFEWTLKSAKQGDKFSQGALGWHYEEGKGVSQNYKEAFKWYKLSAEQGYAYGQERLGGAYYEGIGTSKDIKKALEWWNKAAENGDSYAMGELSYYYGEVEENFTLSLKFARQCAERRHPYCYYSLGRLYSKGSGVKQDYEEAVKWYLKAAEEEEVFAYVELGWHYSEGKGVSQNDKEAVKWYKLAAEAGIDYAQERVGWHYKEGAGVKKDYKEAAKWYTLAALQGDDWAQKSLGYLYENGLGVKLNYEEAYKWFFLAAGQGNQYSKNHLEGLLEKDPTLQNIKVDLKIIKKDLDYEGGFVATRDEETIEVEKKILSEPIDLPMTSSLSPSKIEDSSIKIEKLPSTSEKRNDNLNILIGYEFKPIEKKGKVLSETFIRIEPTAIADRITTAEKGSYIYIAAKVIGKDYYLVNDLNGIAIGYIYEVKVNLESNTENGENDDDFLDIEWGNYYALIIGNSDYLNEGFEDLDTPEADAKELESILKNKYQFKTTLLLDASEEELLEAIYSYRSVLKEDDNLLIYYAGHGYLDEANNVGYWLPVNAKVGKSWTWVSNQDVTDELKAIKAKHIIVIADSCYSGTFVYRSGKDQSKPVEKKNLKIFYEKKNNKKARLALTSGDYQPVPDTIDGRHSPFANSLLKILSENKEILLSSELYSLIENQLALVSTYQEPLYGAILDSEHREGADFIFFPNVD